MENKNRIENKNPVKRSFAKKVRAQPVEVHWTQFEIRDLPPGRQHEIADKLIEYVNRKHKYTILGFTAEENISRAVWHDWCKKYPIINTAHERAKAILGAKRFDAAASKDGSEKLLQWAGQYDVDAFAFMRLLEELKAKKDEDKAPTTIIVNLSDFSNEQASFDQFDGSYVVPSLPTCGGPTSGAVGSEEN